MEGKQLHQTFSPVKKKQLFEAISTQCFSYDREETWGQKFGGRGALKRAFAQTAGEKLLNNVEPVIIEQVEQKIMLYTKYTFQSRTGIIFAYFLFRFNCR